MLLFLFFFRCHRKSFIDVTRHGYKIKKFFQLRKFSVLPKMEGCCESAFPDSSVYMNILARQWLHVLKCLWGFRMSMALKPCWYFIASVPVYRLSLLFLLILVELSLWKVLPSLIRCHCVENVSLYDTMIFWGKKGHCRAAGLLHVPTNSYLLSQPASTVTLYRPKLYN